MTRLVLHIGHPKTGTTALQSVLSANASTLLKEASVLYPTRTTPSEYKHAFVIPWLLDTDNAAIRRRGRSKGEDLRNLSKAYWESLVQEVQDVQPQHLILSAEGFWILRRASDEKIASFHQNLYSIASHISVAGYLKSPVSYFLSMVNQKLRNYREVLLPRPNFYRAAMEAWETAGFDQCNWRIFDRRCLVNQDIVDDFCSQYLPPSFATSHLKRDGVEQANSSVSNEALAILEDTVQRYPILRQDIYERRRSKIVDILRNADASVGGSCRPSLTEPARMGIIRRCADLRWLQDRGLCFPDIDLDAAERATGPALPDQFTKVADFFPLDADRLSSLQAEAVPAIERLFQSPTQNIFWSFVRRTRR